MTLELVFLYIFFISISFIGLLSCPAVTHGSFIFGCGFSLSRKSISIWWWRSWRERLATYIISMFVQDTFCVIKNMKGLKYKSVYQSVERKKDYRRIKSNLMHECKVSTIIQGIKMKEILEVGIISCSFTNRSFPYTWKLSYSWLHLSSYIDSFKNIIRIWRQNHFTRDKLRT